MNIRNIKYGISAACITVLVLLTSGCKRTELEDIEAQGNGVEFAFYENKLPELKSGAAEASGEIRTITLKSDTDEMVLYRTERASGLALDNITETKGTPITTDNLGRLYKDELYTRAYKVEDHNTFLSPLKLAYEENKDGKSIWRVTSSFAWPENSGKLSFWAWAPNSVINPTDDNIKDSEGKMTFTYTMPAPGTETEKTDAEAQKDIILGHTVTAKPSNYIAMTMDHALTALRFEMENTANFKVKSIALGGVYSTGTCTYSPDASKTHSYEQVAWSNLGSTQTYTQDFNQSFIEGSDVVSQELGPLEATFMVIPQCATGGNQISLDMAIEIGGETKHYTASLKNEDWKAGFAYTYSLSMDAEIEYVLNVLNTVSPLPYTGGNLSFAVESFSHMSGSSTRTAVPWILEYYNETDSEWKALNASALPSSLFDADHSFSTFSGSGVSLSGAKENVAVSVKAGMKETTTMSVEDHTKKLRKAPVVGTENKPYDLSMHTVNGVIREEGAPVSANCYVVAAGGWYCLPLVYGNAYSGSTTPNTAAYAPTATTNNAKYLTPFRNAAGTINPDCGGIIETDLGVTLSSASVQWEDLPDASTATMVGSVDVISKPEGAPLDCKYLRFYIKPDTIRQGNIILKVSDGTKTCWSWHIWVIDDPISTTTLRYGNNDATTLELMTFNLGWCDGSETILTQYSGGTLRVRVRQVSEREPSTEDEITISRTAKILSLQTTDGGSVYYEWGRKDPMVAGVHVSDFTPKPFLGEFNVIDRSTTINVNNIAYSIQHPGTFIGDETASGGMWYFEGVGTTTTKATYQNLWDANQTGTTDRETVKTIYDPCPPGFKVPRKNAYAFTTKTNAIGDFEAGYLFKRTSTDGEGMFMYASGYRNHKNGGLSSMGTYGHYWVATATTSGNGNLLRFYNGTVQNTDAEQQCNGYNIRPVAE